MQAQPVAGDHVIVGLSGGVDSAVAAWTLKERGCRVSGLFMVNWTEDEQGYCTSAEDFQAARSVAAELGIPLHRVDFSAEYRALVFDRFLAACRAGKTPNPDVLCNREIKFQPFREHARRLGADWIATGHYARIEHGEAGPRLLRAADENKDQTYFLATVETDHLRRVTFPLGGLRKPEVRDIARRAGLPNHARRDSTGICFIGERPFRAFLARYLPTDAGNIEDDGGRVVGRHDGLAHFTLGQRRGLAIGGQRGACEAPWYVVGKDAPRNRLIVSQDARHPALFARRLRTDVFHWIQRPKTLSGTVHARIRHRQALQECIVAIEPGGIACVEFATAQRAVVPGQYCVLYAGDECLGGGEIETVEPLPPSSATIRRTSHE